MTRTPCTHCGRNSPDAFLCVRCQGELADMLRELAGHRTHDGKYHPGWLDWLKDAAVGQTKLGETGRRTPPRYRNALDGERTLTSQIELLPERWETIEGPAPEGQPWPLKAPSDDGADLNTARHQRYEAVLSRALGAARINLRAAEHLGYTHSVLVEWVRDLCETRGAQCPPNDNSAALALWLARNVSAVAADEGAKSCYREIREIIDDAARIVNRPTPPRILGPCPVMLDASHDESCEAAHPHACALALTSRTGARDVTCRRCGAVHNVGELIRRQLAETDGYLFTASELVHTVLPAIREYVPRRTLSEWRRTGRLQPRDHTPDGEPRYLLADVRELRAQKPQAAPTGAAGRPA